MALTALRPCSGTPRCRALVTSGRCPACSRLADHQRPNAHARGYTKQWSRYATQWKREHPLCGERADGQLYAQHSACTAAGRYVTAQHVDHITPVTGPHDPTFYAPENHQSLCASCHATKTAQEDGAFGNRRRHDGGVKSLAPMRQETEPQPRSIGREIKEPVTVATMGVA